ncbi:hypothetical protein BC332_02736 [Capsicum chinense]|nr:hypothetical protein BC332_02736 [Capsicum chinense]
MGGLCDKGYISSTYKPAVCNSTQCSFAKSHACGDCLFKPQLQPECNNNTCYIWGENPLINTYIDRAEIAEDVLAIGSTPGVLVTLASALPKNVTLVEPPMKRFGVCFSSKNIRRTKVGPDVPVIDFVLQKQNAFWRIYGANSAVQVKKDVLYLAFVGRDQTWEPSIVIGGHQLEENFLVFDLPKKKIGFSSPLKLQQASCSNYDNTIQS